MMQSLFPFPDIRNGQNEMMEDIKNVLDMGKGSVLMANAPTGIGKTVAALVPCVEYALSNNKIVLFLTSKQSQHKIVIDTLRLMKEKLNKCDELNKNNELNECNKYKNKNNEGNFSVVDIISKQAMCPREIANSPYFIFNEMCIYEQKNHKCKYFRSDKGVVEGLLTNILHVEELEDLCAKNTLCPYKAALEAMSDANVIVCDYNYVFTDILETLMEKIDRSFNDVILIVDESHNLPDRIRNYLSGELTLDIISEAAKEIKTVDEVMYRNLKYIEEFFDDFIEKHKENDEVNITRDEIVDGVERALSQVLGGGLGYIEFVEALREIGVKMAEEKKHEEKEMYTLTTVTEFLDNWYTEMPCSRVYKNEMIPMLTFKLLDPSVMSENVFSSVHATILMSGTLYPVEMYADILGAKHAILKNYKSPFPVENKLVLITKKLTTLYSMRSDFMYDEIAKKISQIHKAVNGNIAVFFPSYALMDKIREKFLSEDDAKGAGANKDIVLEERGMNKIDKEMLYNKLKIKSNKILMGVLAGSLSEGVDYPYNILRAVIIVGLPLSPPTLEVKNLRDYYIKKFGQERGILYSYVYPAISKVLQAAGRGIRSENDIGAIVFMDYRFVYPQYRKCLPPEYNIHVTDEAEKFCEEFFKMGFVVKAFEDVEKKVKEGEEKKHTPDSSTEKVKERIEYKNLIPLNVLECIYEFNAKFGKNKIVKILKASNAKFIENGRGEYEKSKSYGTLSNFTAKNIERVIDELIQENYLERAGNFMYPTLKVSKKGECALLNDKKIEIDIGGIVPITIMHNAPTVPTLTTSEKIKQAKQTNTPLLNELKLWRKRISEQKKIPPYCVFHDKTLVAISSILPSTKENLKDIYGFGDKKIKEYGEDVLNIVKAHKNGQ